VETPLASYQAIYAAGGVLLGLDALAAGRQGWCAANLLLTEPISFDLGAGNYRLGRRYCLVLSGRWPNSSHHQ
jgi:hypothetical protein